MDDLIDFLSAQFHSVDQFSNDWVSNIIDGNFTEFDTISGVVKPEFFEIDVSTQVELCKKLSKLLYNFQKNSTMEDKIWEKMTERGISGKKLMLLFWYSIETAISKNSTGLDIKSGIAAASCYHYLCCIKGAQAYHIFNPVLFEKCLELFRIIFRCIKFEARGANTKSKPKGKGKSKKKEETVEDEQDMGVALEKSELVELLEEATSALYVLLNNVALSAFKEASEATALFIRDIATIDATKDTCVDASESMRDFSRLPYMSDRSFALMHRLVEEKHSNEGGLLVYSRIVFPRLAYWGFDLSTVASSSSIPASYTMWKDLMIRFIISRIRVGLKSEISTIVKILENLFCRCTDRQDYRSKLSATVVQILLELPRKEQYDFLCRLNVFSRNPKTSLRNFTVEVVPQILKSINLEEVNNASTEEAIDETVDETRVDETSSANENNTNDEDSDDEIEKLRRKRAKEAAKKKKLKRPVLEKVDAKTVLYDCLVRCCVDKSSGVRGKGIIQVAQLLTDPIHGEKLKSIAQKMYEETPQLFTGKLSEEGEVEEQEGIDEDVLDDSLIEITNVLFYIITSAMKDEKAVVRKSGIIAMQSYFRMIDNRNEFDEALTLLKKSVVDASVLVRKQGAETINQILSNDTLFKDHLETMWLKTVLPMINDREQSVSDVAGKLISETIVQPILNDDETVWSLLGKIEQEDNHRRLLVRALFHQSKEKKVNERIVDVLLTRLLTDAKRTDVIWMMLAELSIVFQIKPAKALDHWFTLSENESSNKVRYIAKVITSSVSQLTPAQKSRLTEDLEFKISQYQLEAGHISSVYLCLAKLLDAVGEEASGWAVLREYGAKVLSDCKRQVRKNLDEFSSEIHMVDGESLSTMETKLIRVITTIGEVIQFSPTLLNSCGELVNALKIIMASADLQADEQVCGRIINSAVPSVNPTPLPSRTGTALGLYPDAQSEMFSQPMSMGSQPLSSQGQLIIPHHMINKKDHCVGVQLFTPLVRAYCVLAIGKFCLMDEKLAKSCVPVLVRQLKVNQDHIIRNNVVFVICDLCIRYTLLVDRYSPIIASCLKDRSTLVRHHTLESLTNLIKEQFIRWEGQIMYRFVSTILDENRAIREYAEFCLKEVLLLQFPGMFYNHFIECLIYFNDVPRKYMPGASEDLDVDSSLKFSLSGKRNYNARMILYRFMLATFDDKQKFMTMSHICEQIFRPIYSGEMDFQSKHVLDLLTDSFDIMSSKEIKLNMDVGKGNDEDEDEPSPAIVAAAKNMISTAFRKGIILSIMPPLLEMRSFLLENKSPLIKQCFAVLRAICREHKEQIDEFLAGDKQLKAEIEFDIKRYELYEIAQRKKAAEAAQKARRERRSIAVANMLVNNTQPIVKSEPTSQGNEENVKCDSQPPVPVNRKSQPMENIAEQDEPMEEGDDVVPVESNKSQIAKSPKCDNKATTSSSSTSAEDQSTQNDEPEGEEMEVDAQKENLESRAKSRSPSIVPEVSDTANTSIRTRRQKKLEAEKTANESATFVVPKAGRMSVRKRSRLSVTNSVSEEDVFARAISTPNKTMDPNLTFADLNLSAIRSDSEVKPPRLSVRSTRRTTLDRINE